MNNDMITKIVISCRIRFPPIKRIDIIDNNNPWDIKYVVIVALDKGEFGQKSYRRIDEDIDCNKLAMLHGGGGHVGSAAVVITEKQKMKIKQLEKKDALEYIANSSYSVE